MIRFAARAAFALVVLIVAAAPARARVEFRSFLPPALKGQKKDCRVYFPPSYDRPEARERRYPLIVFLHGWPGSEGNWPGQGHAIETLDAMSAAGEIPEVLALFPDGGGEGLFGRSCWVNAVDGRSDMETYVVRDLVAWADSTLRTRSGARWRGAIGLSDGATGAMNLVLRHPDVFGACGAHSGDYRFTRDVSSARVFGPDPRGAVLRAEYSPLEELPHVAERLGASIIYFDCGVDDESIGENRELDRLLTKHGVAHTFHEFAGSHDWGYWRTHVRDALRVITAGMR